MLSLSTCQDYHFEKNNIVKLGNYSVDRDQVIAYGGFSKVYLAETEQGNKVCVKAMSKSIKKKQLIKMAKEQAKILALLSDPSVCQLITTFQSQNHYYIVLNYYQGPTLSQYIRSKKMIECQQAQQILRQIIKTLKYLHQKRIMHRDLKPDNILYGQNNIIIIDFGFACRLSKGENTILNQYVGTPSYMSPQLLEKKKYNSKSDIWSLGVIAYEMIYGKLPWIGKNEKQLLFKIKTQKLNLDGNKKIPLSLPLRQMIFKCLQIDPQKRMSWKQLFYFNQNQNRNTVIYENSEDDIRSSFCGCQFFS